MKLARTLHLDVSDSKVFLKTADSGEWAITGTFAFSDIDLDIISTKEKLAFREGWLGTASFGRATFVRVQNISSDDCDQILRNLSEHLLRKYGAPGMPEALEAAKAELRDMQNICDHPQGTVLAIKREMYTDNIEEQVRVVPPTSFEAHAKIWAIENDK